MNKEIILFKKNKKDFTFEDLLLKIYENSEEKKENIQKTAELVSSKIESVQDAVLLMPQLISLQDAAIKNDDALVKMAAIVQRTIGKSKNKFNTDDVSGISAEERQMLLETAKQMKEASLPGASGDD